MKASTAVKASAAVETAKAGLSPERVASGNPSMVEPAKGAGVRSCHSVRVVVANKPLMSVKTSTMKIGVIEVRLARMKTIAVDNSSAMGDVCVVVVDDPAAFVAPVISPVMPAPAEAAI
jgi:hypothetical protein